jgi:cytochrome c oxidase assembly factor CtaG
LGNILSKILYYFLVLVILALYLVLIGAVLTFIFNSIGLPHQYYELKQFVLVLVAFLFRKKLLYPVYNFINRRIGISK